MNTFARLLTAILIACVLLLPIGGSAYAMLRLNWRAETAERALSNEQLSCRRLEHFRVLNAQGA